MYENLRVSFTLYGRRIPLLAIQRGISHGRRAHCAGRVPKSDLDWTRTRGHTPGFGPDSESESAGSREPGRTRTRTRTPRSSGRPDSDWTRTPGSRWPAGLLPGLPWCRYKYLLLTIHNCSLRLPYIYSGLLLRGLSPCSSMLVHIPKPPLFRRLQEERQRPVFCQA